MGSLEGGFYDEGGTPYVGDVTALHQTGFDATTGKPYLIKWDTADPNYFETPLFNDVTISAPAPAIIISTDSTLAFAGTYSPVEIGATGDNTLLYLGDEDNLYWPNAAMTIGCQRAYFQLNGITAGDPTDPSAGIRAFVLNFDDSEATGITAQPMFNVQ